MEAEEEALHAVQSKLDLADSPPVKQAAARAPGDKSSVQEELDASIAERNALLQHAVRVSHTLLLDHPTRDKLGDAPRL
eukprot:SAG11_NODE_29337_length_312_cov_0.422535_1_plen_78_part_10